MREHHLAVSRTARYFSLGDPARAREAWVVCHGYGQLAARFLERFRPLDDGTRYLVAPEGLSRFYLSDHPAERRVGASWMTREDRLREIDDYVAYLDALVRELRGPGSPGGPLPLTALGFSQGSATVCRWVAMRNEETAPPVRLIVWGGEIPPDLDLAAEPAAGRLRQSRLTLVYGRDDGFFPPKIVAATEERLRAHAIPFALVPFAGGHEIREAVLRDIARA